MDVHILLTLTSFVFLIQNIESIHFDFDVILSFVTLDERPVSLLLPFLCWKQHALKSLARSMCEVGVSTATSLQYNRTEYDLQYILIIADLTCVGTDRFLVKASKEGYFKAPYRWLLLNYEDDDTPLVHADILVDSDVVLVKRINDQEYWFIEAYKISENSEIIHTTRLIWRRNTTKQDNNTNNITIMDQSKVTVTKYGWMEDYRSSNVLSSRRYDLRGHTLTMVNVITDSNETRLHMNDRLYLHQDCITKMSYAVVSICFHMLNATERLLFTHTWGYKDKNGQWQGIVDHLLKKDADLGTLTIFTQERMDVVDYIAMVGTTAVRFVFREPPLSYISNIFTLPFSGTVWLAIFICVLGCSIFLYIASKWEASMGMHPLQLDGSWADVLILIIGAVLQQGCTLEPRYGAGRCVTLILFIALTVLYAAYSANIVVLLRAPSSSVRSLPDLLNSPLKLGASDFEYNRYFFKKLNDPIRKAIYEKKIAPKGKQANFYSMKDGVERIRKGLFAFHMELNPGYRLIQETYQEDEKCDLVEIDYINEIDPWVPGQKRSPFKDLFKINFLKIRESGVQANVHQRLTVARPRCSGHVSTFSSVGITDMYPAMLMTLYGMLLAPAVLLLEITYKRLMTIRQQKRTLTDPDHIPFRH
ncbi:glutamate receptor 1-like [Spodoptera litura]|uniref:Glutamate receptor 1-like n=1 Tax=Spodoptera litura TaxID=69820 RepID=A0A9J7III3_SPOLT|nr:glutamate receptor 1-like [Spodoptera litura]